MTLMSEEEVGRVLVVGTAPPTRCGLASYTFNVSNALANQNLDVDILRVLDDGESEIGEPLTVSAHWRRQHRIDARSSASFANTYDAVLLQHEFGIYPGDDGVGVLDFLEHLDVPVVTVLHTIVSDPSTRQRRIVDELGERSETLIVHSSTARERLLRLHDFDHREIKVIPHGASSRIGLSQPLHRTVPSMLTWGLIGPGKGIEHGIIAIALLRGRGIDVEYVISGATHPNVLRDAGDGYRHSLVALSRQLGVEDLIRFDAHYRSREEQDQIIRSASVVLLPYDSREQVTSGVLVEALASGKPIISTAFPHAKELRDCGGIALVDHQRPDEIADAAQRILGDPGVHEVMRSASWVEGLRHDWNVVGPRFSQSVVRFMASSELNSNVFQFELSDEDKAVVA